LVANHFKQNILIAKNDIIHSTVAKNLHD